MLRGRRKQKNNYIQNKGRYTRMSLEQQLEGMVTLCVQTDAPHQVLARLSESHIVLYHVAAEKNVLYVTIELSDFKRTQRILRDYHIRFRICGKRGVPFFISRCK